jgi:anti-sigma regulatory factor (Ser/Thr protein kinase)
MSGGDASDPPVIEWGSASAALAGESESGDLAFVSSSAEGALVAVIDGLGHGPEAALAARTARQLLETNAREDPLTLIERCHEGMRKTRGAVMSLGSWNVRTASLTWTGVGNVEGLLVRGNREQRDEALTLRGGVVGYRLPSLRSETLHVERGDTLIFTTDGLHREWRAEIDLRSTAQSIADTLLERAAKGTDDACVAVARYVAQPNVRVPIRHPADAARARQLIRDFAYRRGFQEVAVEGLATAASELVHNMLKHAGAGELSIAFVAEGERLGLCLIASDSGPGIPNIARALEDGYSTAGSLGLGLSSARRFADDFALSSAPGQGTTVTLKKWLR